MYTIASIADRPIRFCCDTNNNLCLHIHNCSTVILYIFPFHYLSTVFKWTKKLMKQTYYLKFYW